MLGPVALPAGFSPHVNSRTASFTHFSNFYFLGVTTVILISFIWITIYLIIIKKKHLYINTHLLLTFSGSLKCVSVVIHTKTVQLCSECHHSSFFFNSSAIKLIARVPILLLNTFVYDYNIYFVSRSCNSLVFSKWARKIKLSYSSL